MAKMKLDPALRSVRGRAGNYVFRKTRGQMFLSSRPDVTPRDPTTAQTVVQEKFRQAAAYTSEVLQDPVRRAEYEQLAHERNESVRTVLMGDFLNSPKVTDLDVSRFSGKAGDVITVRATDDVEVVSVEVKISDAAAGTVLEKGAAVKFQGVWTYTTTTALLAPQPVTIEATAFDRPGHLGRAAKSYP